MNILSSVFLLLSLTFHTFAFSQEKIGPLLNLCLSEITERRIILIEEMNQFRRKIKEEENVSSRLPSDYDDRLYKIIIKVFTLNTITAKPLTIDLSKTTCDTFLDEISVDPEIKIKAVDMFFSHFEKNTDAFIKEELIRYLSNAVPSLPIEEMPKPQIDIEEPTEEEPVKPSYLWSYHPFIQVLFR